MAAKSRKPATRKTNVSAEDAAANKRFFTITAISVVVILAIIFIIFLNS